MRSLLSSYTVFGGLSSTSENHGFKSQLYHFL